MKKIELLLLLISMNIVLSSSLDSKKESLYAKVKNFFATAQSKFNDVRSYGKRSVKEGIIGKIDEPIGTIIENIKQQNKNKLSEILQNVFFIPYQKEDFDNHRKFVNEYEKNNLEFNTGALVPKKEGELVNKLSSSIKVLLDGNNSYYSSSVFKILISKLFFDDKKIENIEKYCGKVDMTLGVELVKKYKYLLVKCFEKGVFKNNDISSYLEKNNYMPVAKIFFNKDSLMIGMSLFLIYKYKMRYIMKLHGLNSQSYKLHMSSLLFGGYVLDSKQLILKDKPIFEGTFKMLSEEILNKTLSYAIKNSLKPNESNNVVLDSGQVLNQDKLKDKSFDLENLLNKNYKSVNGYEYKPSITMKLIRSITGADENELNKINLILYNIIFYMTDPEWGRREVVRAYQLNVDEALPKDSVNYIKNDIESNKLDNSLSINVWYSFVGQIFREFVLYKDIIFLANNIIVNPKNIREHIGRMIPQS